MCANYIPGVWTVSSPVQQEGNSGVCCLIALYLLTTNEVVRLGGYHYYVKCQTNLLSAKYLNVLDVAYMCDHLDGWKV